MAEDRMQLQRFELKYRIKHEATALAVRDFVSMYLEVDEYGATLPQYSYPVHSLYLDSPGLKLYWDTINGSKNRYNPQQGGFLEARSAANGQVQKTLDLPVPPALEGMACAGGKLYVATRDGKLRCFGK